MNGAYPKSVRLRKRRQFQRMAHHAVRLVGSWIVIEARPNKNSLTRLGITVSRHYGKAFQRNRFKRVVREAFRLSRPQLKSGYDLNIKPRSASHLAKAQDIAEELLLLMREK